MDYRKLLIKYINHVGDMEGISFIDKDSYHNRLKMSKEEIEELEKLDAEYIWDDTEQLKK